MVGSSPLYMSPPASVSGQHCSDGRVGLKPGPHRTRPTARLEALSATVRARPGRFVPSKKPRASPGGGFDGTERAGTRSDGHKQGRHSPLMGAVRTGRDTSLCSVVSLMTSSAAVLMTSPAVALMTSVGCRQMGVLFDTGGEVRAGADFSGRRGLFRPFRFTNSSTNAAPRIPSLAPLGLADYVINVRYAAQVSDHRRRLFFGFEGDICRTAVP